MKILRFPNVYISRVASNAGFITQKRSMTRETSGKLTTRLILSDKSNVTSSALSYTSAGIFRKAAMTSSGFVLPATAAKHPFLP
jgi:hypothetical protein